MDINNILFTFPLILRTKPPMKFITMAIAAPRNGGEALYRSVQTIFQQDWSLKLAVLVLFLGPSATLLITRPLIFSELISITHITQPQKKYLPINRPLPLAPLMVKIGPQEIPPIQELLEFYSFEYTSLGFELDDLSLLQQAPRHETERLLLASIPKYLRDRAKIYIRPVLLLSEKYQVDPFWVLSVMWTESHFHHTATSHVGAAGLMQIMPATRKYLYNSMKQEGRKLVVEEKDFKLKEYFKVVPKGQAKTFTKKLMNIEIGVMYLKQLLKQFNYNHKLATVAYNMGPGWTANRLRNNLPVGEDNRYLDKVEEAYKILCKRLYTSVGHGPS